MAERRPDWIPVTRWETLRIVKRMDFVLSILLTPALLFGVSLLMSARKGGDVHRVAVVRVDATNAVVGRGDQVLPPLAGHVWVDPGAAGADSVGLAAGVRRKTYALALVIRPGGEGRWALDITARRDLPRWAGAVREHVRKAARLERARAMGLEPERLAALDESVVERTRSASGQPAASRRAGLFLVLAVLMLTSLTVMTGVSYMMVGISGEKQARVTEVVMSAIPAQAWMDGKIVAYSIVGLIGGVVWGASLLVMAGPFAFQLPGSVNLVTLLVTALFALLGLYLYNAMMAALMASAQNLETASRWQANFVMLPFLPLLALGSLLNDPDSLAMRLLTIVPFFAPMLAPVRLVQDAIAWWEVALALAVLVAACAFMRRAAGRVFRLGMLMYGKDMTLPELLRWMRTG